MKIEIGKRYRMRDGRIATIESKANTAGWFFGRVKGEDHYRTFFEDGSWSSKNDPVCWDLVEPISELKLELGKRYRTRDGRAATVIKLTHVDVYPDVYPFAAVIDDERIERCYTANGYWGGESCPCGVDLIELIESRFTVESLSNDGFSVRIQHGTPKAKFNVELQKHGAGATAYGDNLDTALAEAHTLWESAASRDYVVKLYIFQGGIVRTTTPGGEKPIASKIVRFNAKSGDFE